MIQMEVSIEPDLLSRIEEAKLSVRTVSFKTIKKMAVLAVNEIKKVLNVPARKIGKKSRGGKGLKKNLTRKQVRLIYSRKPMYEHSKPGEPPRKISGELQRSTSWVPDSGAQTVKVGMSRRYGKYLEQGTRKMAVRPYLVSTIRSLIPQFVRMAQEANLFEALRRLRL